MITTTRARPRFAFVTVAFVAIASFGANGSASECRAPEVHKNVSPVEVQTFVNNQGMNVLTFVGYSGAEYEDPAAMLDRASSVLKRFDPATTLVSIGATPQGIGGVYKVAKARGFKTMGIVSSLALQEHLDLSPCVDEVFYVRDSSWGGFVSGSKSLSPTSSALVSVSATVVGIGGGEAARDELLAARAAGKKTEFIPADMNHQLAREKAEKKGAAEPIDFRGAAHAALVQ